MLRAEKAADDDDCELEEEHEEEEEGERRSLLRVRSTAEQRRARNRSKRVKLHSKRMRPAWPTVARFLSLRDAVALAGTCRRLQRLLDSDDIWLEACERVRRERMTQLLVPRGALLRKDGLPPRKDLQRLLHVRRNQDPTGALRIRLREAERDSFRLAAWQSKIREVVTLNVPLALVLLAVSAYAFATDDATERHFIHETSEPTPTTTSSQPAVNPVKTFLLVQDVLLLVALAVVTAGHMADNALYSVVVLAAIEMVSMLQTLPAWSASEAALAIHASLVGVALVANLAVALRKNREYQREVAAFTSSY